LNILLTIKYAIASVIANVIKTKNDFSSSDSFLILDKIVLTMIVIKVEKNIPAQQNGKRAKPEASIMVFLFSEVLLIFSHL
jgi:hypothetical protein